MRSIKRLITRLVLRKINVPEIFIGKDGAEMAPIPSGEFQMGSENAETPLHTVYLDAFYIDRYSVTNALYKKFVDSTGHSTPEYWDDPRFSFPDQPVVGVNWHDAEAYANWAEKRLPTEAEWEKAARGGLVSKRYPWGNDILHEDANYGPSTDGISAPNHTLLVGSYAPNGYGLYDMAGNVWEWCSDWYAEDYYVNSPGKNPQGPDTGEAKVLRGGAWDYPASFQKVNCRICLNPLYSNVFVGFRCAK